jgi:predicted ATP-dependent endonuclease of OLD family
MILKKLTINHFGPFSSRTVLDVSPNVTILTGANDVGKSSILRLIEIIFKNKRDVQKKEYNITRLVKAPWDRDDQWHCDVELEAPPDFQDRLNTMNRLLQYGSKDRDTEIEIPLLPGDRITLRYYLAPNFYKSGMTWGYEVIEVNGKKSSPAILAALSDGRLESFLPRISNLSEEDSSSSLDKRDANLGSLTKDLLDIAFDNKGFPGDDLKLTNATKEDLRSGAEHINQKLQKLFNQSIHTKFRFEFSEPEETIDPPQDDRRWISKLLRPARKALETPRKRTIDLHIEDELRGETHLSYRGSGVIKLAYLACKLMDWRLDHQQNIILMDEPENSLHAASQHMLRTALEGLAQNHNLQIIYSTHSPSMINSLQPENIRLVKREATDTQVTSAIDNRPFDRNFLPVRASLGLTPADSLLYAPITVIVEGVTEVLCIPFLLKRLQESRITNFAKSEHLLSMTHFFNGEGSAYEYFCRLAKSQGNKVIIFADGDKKEEIKRLDLKNKHPDVAIILLDEGKEFEQIVPLPVYFLALARITKENALPEVFAEWQTQTALPERMMFSKRVDRWMKEVYGHSYSKPEVMRMAVEMASISDINLKPFEKLIQAIRNAVP